MHGQDGVSLAVAQAEEVEFLRSSSTTLQGMGTLRKAPSPVQRGDSLMGPSCPGPRLGTWSRRRLEAASLMSLEGTLAMQGDPVVCGLLGQ